MSKNFRGLWADAVERKSSLLCVGIDAAEPGQRGAQSYPQGVGKLSWTLGIVDAIAPYAAAVKINRNYYKDFSRSDMQILTQKIREHGMLSIDDTKLADIGDTNAAALYHASQEGYDALTYAPFPGNALQTAEQAKSQGIGLIMLVLMSNPEFKLMKDALIGGLPFYEYLAHQAEKGDVDGVVIGAPSVHNHITIDELDKLATILTTATILVPGIGAQGGDIGPILQRFGRRAIVNVGRAIIYAADPAQVAKQYRDQIATELAQF
ncbi:MAG: orotidine 5'-phosphate decarboxylase [Chitinophagaceae bacterium]|nr:orotidine 5'-phosphate decarboxylase [Oligoflexus sp.]